jgi:hypothetical protein
LAFALILAMVVLVIGLLWAAWSRLGRDPQSTVADFSRALSAMQPGSEKAEARGEPSSADGVSGDEPEDTDGPDSERSARSS